jgi:ParB family chromosome partitioning protein
MQRRQIPPARQIPLAQLFEAEWNANRVPRGLLAKIRNSIERFGFVENLVARPHPQKAGCFEVLSGNHRLRLLDELGFRPR